MRVIKFRGKGITVHPSWHDIDIVKRASVRLLKWIRKGCKE